MFLAEKLLSFLKWWSLFPIILDKITEKIITRMFRSKTCISNEIYSRYFSPSLAPSKSMLALLAGGSFLFHKDRHCAGCGGRMGQSHHKFFCFDRIAWKRTKFLTLFVQDCSLPRPFPHNFSRLPLIYQGFVGDEAKRFNIHFGRYVFFYIGLRNERTGGV